MLGHLISNAKLLAETFRSISFSHVRRLGNSAAHNILNMLNMSQIFQCGWKMFLPTLLL